jgi:hypothetical protein
MASANLRIAASLHALFMFHFQAVLGERFIEGHRIAAVEAGLAEMVARIGHAHGRQQTVQAQVVERIQPRYASSSGTVMRAAISSPLVEKSMP